MKSSYAVLGLAASASAGLVLPRCENTTVTVTVTAPAESASATATTVEAVPSATGNACVVTDFSAISAAVASCTEITLKDIHAPSNKTIDLSKVLPNTVVTFAGTTTFGFTNISSFDPIVVGGTNVTVTAEPDALIDGNGQIYWDGIGSK